MKIWGKIQVNNVCIIKVQIPLIAALGKYKYQPSQNNTCSLRPIRTLKDKI